MRFVSLLCIATLAVSCKGKEDTPHTPEPAQPSTAAQAALPSPAPSDPSEVLAEVDGEKLTHGQAEQEVANRLAAIRDRVPADRLGMIRQQMMDNVVEQFIMRKVLLNEAARQDITISDAEREKEFDKIRESLPEGMTLEDVMKNSPLGEERMREEVLTGIKINKLLDQQMADNQQPTDEEIDAFIEENQQRLQMPDTVHAKHILLKVEEGADEAAKTAKREEIEGLREQLVEGADFSEVAKEHSDCPSASRGGDLGTFPKGRMVPEFEAAAFSQEPGEIGEIVETQFGFHVIKVLERNEAGDVPREQVEDMLKNRKRQETMKAYIDELKAQADIKDYRPKKPQTPMPGMPQMPPPQPQPQPQQ